MSDIKVWSDVDDNNTAAVPDGAPEGWKGANVNNTIREVMASVRRWYDDPEWLDPFYKLAVEGAPSLVKDSDTQFTITNKDATSILTVGKVVRVSFSGTNTSICRVVSSTPSGSDTVVIIEGGVVPASVDTLHLFANQYGDMGGLCWGGQGTAAERIAKYPLANGIPDNLFWYNTDDDTLEFGTGGAWAVVDPGDTTNVNAAGDPNDVLITDGAGTSSFASATYTTGPAEESILPFPRGHIRGFNISRDSINTVAISSGECRGGLSAANPDVANLVLGDFTKTLNAGWTAGTGNGGYAGAGAIAVGEWYHVFAIGNDAGNVDIGVDDDIDCTNLLALSSYDHYRRVGSIKMDSADADDMVPITQVGDNFVWDTVPAVVNHTSGGSSWLTGTDRLTFVDAPPDVITKVDFLAWGTPVFVFAAGTTTIPTPLNGIASLYSIWGAGGTNSSPLGVGYVFTNTSQQITILSTAAGVLTVDTQVHSYTDTRGKDD